MRNTIVVNSSVLLITSLCLVAITAMICLRNNAYMNIAATNDIMQSKLEQPPVSADHTTCPSLAYTCLRHGSSLDNSDLSQWTKDSLYVDDVHKTVACIINKSGCSTWKYLFMRSTGHLPKDTNGKDAHVHNVELLHKYGIRKLSNYSSEEADRRLRSYYKYIVVRNPYDRLYSAYRDKFVINNKSYFERYGRKIIRKYRQNATEEEILKGSDVSFAEFADYLTDDLEYFDPHWKTYHLFCDPCAVRYDKVVRMENMEDDSKEVLDIIGLTPNDLPKLNTNRKETSNRISDVYATLDENRQLRLMALYKQDFELFGYTWDNKNFIGTCKCCQ